MEVADDNEFSSRRQAAREPELGGADRDGLGELDLPRTGAEIRRFGALSGSIHRISLPTRAVGAISK